MDEHRRVKVSQELIVYEVESIERVDTIRFDIKQYDKYQEQTYEQYSLLCWYMILRSEFEKRVAQKNYK